MTAAELMKPRFEIIADYPDNDMGKIGEILDRDWTRYVDDDDNNEAIWKVSDFPHLFRSLDWFEYRKKEDMPMKLISRAIPNNTEIIHIEEWDMDNLIGWIDKENSTCASLLSWNYEYGFFPVD